MSNIVAQTGEHGWIIMDKPPGLSSSQAVGVIKRLARQSGWGKVKVGHGGTLDPLATGVLPIALGEATKLTGRMLDADKAYEFELTFGAATATDDAEGEVTAMSDVRPTLAALQATLPRFTGPISQRPPAYSALKVDGRRAYALARAGEVVELAERQVTIHALEITSLSPALRATPLPPAGEGTESARKSPLTPAGEGQLAPASREREVHRATLAVRCSKGTYVRSLARDLALALGAVGHVTMLRRTRAGPFTLMHAHTVDNLQQLCDGGGMGQALLPLTAGLDDIPAYPVSGLEAALLRQGQTLPARPHFTGLALALHGNIPVALVTASDGRIRVERGFNLMFED